MRTENKPATFKLTIEYDGSAFHGWQRQKQARTVQQTIEQALAVMTREAVVLIGSGRTDAGVHALGQTASFRTRCGLTATAFRNGLNSLLPDDVVVHACDSMPDAFHARFDAKLKHYRYHILNRPVPPAVGRQFVWHIRRPLDAPAMAQAAQAFVGTHDFKAVEGAGSPRSHTVRTVADSSLELSDDGRLIYDIQADGFLRFMVRNIVGTLVEVGLGKRTIGDVGAVLQAKDRSRAGPTAPPQGLFLMAVIY